MAGFVIAAMVLIILAKKVIRVCSPTRQLVLVCVAGILSLAWAQYAWGVLSDYEPFWSRILSYALIALTASMGWLCITHCMNQLGKSGHNKNVALTLHCLAFISIATISTWKLATYGRYLEFPINLFTIPVLGLSAIALCNRVVTHQWLPGLVKSRHSVWANRVLIILFIVASVGLIAGEAKSFMNGGDFQAAHPEWTEAIAYGLKCAIINTQLLVWIGYLGVMAFTFKILPQQNDSTGSNCLNAAEPIGSIKTWRNRKATHD